MYKNNENVDKEQNPMEDVTAIILNLQKNHNSISR